MDIRKILLRLQIKMLKKASDKRKIKFLRKQGMKIGENCHFNTMSFSTEPYLIEIGNHVAIAAGSELITHDGAIWCFRDEIKNADIFGKIKIGNNVFIGNNCTILPNTVIADNCIIGAGSIVRGNFPENSVIIGNPAKVFMKMSVQKLLYLQSPGLFITQHLTDTQKAVILKKHFSID
jgi:acetyltransferase-like isoleucine patch superfamily enzyme